MNKVLRATAFGLAAVFCCVTMAACIPLIGPQERKSGSETVSESVDRLKIKIPLGNVKIVPDDRQDFKMDYDVRYVTWGDVQLPTLSASGGTLYLEQQSFSVAANYECDITLYIPRDFAGDIDGTLNLGYFRADGLLSDRVRLTLNLGDMEFVSLSKNPDFDLTLNLGKLDLTLPRDAAFSYDFDLDLGSINMPSELSGSVKKNVVQSEATGRCGEGGGQVLAKLNLGDLSLNLK